MWAAITDLTWLELTTLSLLAVWNLCTYAFVWMSVTPGLGFWHAMVMTQATTAVANTVPAGSAIGIGMTYTMLGSWGYSRSRSTTAVLVSGVWNSFIKLGLPVLALVLLQGGAGGGRVTAALLGIAGLVAAVVVFTLLLRSEDQARRFGLLAARVATRLRRLIGRGRWPVGSASLPGPDRDLARSWSASSATCGGDGARSDQHPSRPTAHPWPPRHSSGKRGPTRHADEHWPRPRSRPCPGCATWPWAASTCSGT